MFIQRPITSASQTQRGLVHGVGVNDAPYITSHKDDAGKIILCPYYKTWTSMLERVFSKKFHAKKPTYTSCTLDDSWKTFSVFRAWMETQSWEGRVLDKDLLSWDNKHYGPNTCLFISRELNNLLTLRRNYRGELPLGVSKTQINGYEYFVASCSFYGKQKRLGYFKSIEEAAETYRTAKLAYIEELAKAEKDPRVQQALRNLH